MRPVSSVAVLLALAAGVSPTMGQATSDRVPAGRVPPSAVAVHDDPEQNRYHLGPIRLFPFVQIDNAGYNNNVFGTASGKVADETADISAGARLLIPIGSKLFLRGLAAPEYIWYDHLAEGRAFGGNYEAQFLALFNHLTLDADARDSRTTSLLNAETLRTVLATTRVARARGEIDVAGPLSFFGEGESAQYRYEANPIPDQPLEDPAILDRQEDRVRGGFRLHAREETSFSLAAEVVRTRFDDPSQGGDNRSEAILLGVVIDRPKVYFDLSAGYRDSRPIDGSRFRELRTPTGSYFASYLLRSSVEIFVNGFRGAEYSVSESNPYYVATSNGGGVNLRLGSRLTVRAYGDYAENRYPAASATEGGVRRTDTIGTFGGGLQVSLGRRLVLGVFGTEYRYDSNVPGVARNIFRLTSLISFQLSPIVSIRGGLS
jgi:hypothetical protein